MPKKRSYEFALYQFKNVLHNLQHPTKVVQVVTFPINTSTGVWKALHAVPPLTAVWQHTATSHTAAIWIPRGQGYRFNRGVIDLISSGVNTPGKFLAAWQLKNGDVDFGYFPTAKGSATSSVRQTQMSYIVADFDRGIRRTSKLPSLAKNRVDRTHLISEQITGVESHRGLLIDFDGYLNANPMNKFEQTVLTQTKKYDLLWICNVWRTGFGTPQEALHLRYDIKLAKDGSTLVSHEWIDDRWWYLWFMD